MIRLFGFTSILFLALALASCDSALTSDQEVQYVADVQWRANSSAMLGFVQYFVATAVNPDPGRIFELNHIDATGKIGASFPTAEPAYDNFYYGIQLNLFPTSDDQSVIAQLGRNLYRVNIASGNDKRIIVDFHLLTASADGRFVVGTHSQQNLKLKSVFVYDVSADTARQIVRFEVDMLSALPGVWLNDGKFAVTVNDSVEGRHHIDIYDTTGMLQHQVSSAATPPHNADFIPATNHLYFKGDDGSVGMLDLTTGFLSQPVHFTVQNFDISKDERYLYYSSGINGQLNRHEFSTGTETELATNVFWGVFLSPDETKIAYVYERKVNFQEVKVVDIP